MSTQLALNLLKVETSELAAAAVLKARCELVGCQAIATIANLRWEDTCVNISLAPIMINNDRILANAEAGVLMSQPPVWLVA